MRNRISAVLIASLLALGAVACDTDGDTTVPPADPAAPAPADDPLAPEDPALDDPALDDPAVDPTE